MKMFGKTLNLNLILGLALIFSAGANANFADDETKCKAKGNKALFVLDISGSMAGIGITKAREALTTHMEVLPDTAELGLLTFSGCSADKVKYEVPMATGTKPTILAAANRATPMGSTALDLALKRAHGIINDSGQCLNIVILSDGDETCGGSPAYTAGGIAAQCSCVNVIGMNVPNWTKTNLENISRAGNGSYCGASTAEELSNCLDLINPPEKAKSGSKKKDSKKNGDDKKDDDDDDKKNTCRPGSRDPKCKKDDPEKDPKKGSKEPAKATSSKKKKKTNGAGN